MGPWSWAVQGLPRARRLSGELGSDAGSGPTRFPREAGAGAEGRGLGLTTQNGQGATGRGV